MSTSAEPLGAPGKRVVDAGFQRSALPQIDGMIDDTGAHSRCNSRCVVS